MSDVFWKNLKDAAVAEPFTQAAGTMEKQRKKRPSPLSIRLTDEERVELKRAAAGQPLNGYIRDRLFGASGKAARSRRRKPVKDHVALAQALGLLGALDLGPSLRTLARAAESGALEMSPEVEEELRNACAVVLAIHSEILRALGYPDGSGE